MIMRKWLGAWAILFFTLAPAQAAPPTAPERHFTARDLFDLEIASDPQISPDGRWIAYVRRSGDIMTDRFRQTIWLIDTTSGRQTPLAAGAGSHSQPRWSPNGDRLAFISTAEGNRPQLFVRWMSSGESARITGLPDSPSSIAWSPDGRQIAYSMFMPDEGMRLGTPLARPEGAQWAEPLQVISAVTYRFDGAGYLRPGYEQIFLVSADGGAPRQLSFGPYNVNGPLAWSGDGRAILFGGNRTENWEREGLNTEIYALDIASNQARALTSRDGPDAQPAVSPDGRLIAYTGFDDRNRGYENVRLYVMNADGSNPRVLTGSLDRSIDSPTWAADGRSIYVSYDDHGETRVARVGLDGSVRTVAEGLGGPAIDRPYTGGSFTVARDGAVAIAGDTPTRPADIMLVRGGARRQLTRLNAELLDSKRLGEVRRISFASSHDNRPVEAWITLPPEHRDGERHPLILEIHGGPFAAYGPHFSTDNQLYAAAGYVVVSVNPRGSTSYGEEFANLIHHAYPGNDYDDLMSAVDAAIAQGVADPERLFVTGGSGGGVLTAWIVGRTNRFRAAVTQKPVIDWASFVLTADNPSFFSRYWFGRFPWEDHEAFWRRSPLSLVGNVQTPTMVVVGAEDYRTPVSESEQYYTALQLRGVPTALVKVPGASHGGIAARPSQSGAKANAILAWFQRYRDGMPARPAAATGSE
jgi:dipeptidyl aminopeptidase/acylaminoacyl peptidase